MKKFIARYWLLIVSIIYLIWPIDFIPEVFGPFGFIDDSGLLITAVIREIIINRKERKLKDSV